MGIPSVEWPWLVGVALAGCLSANPAGADDHRPPRKEPPRKEVRSSTRGPATRRAWARTFSPWSTSTRGQRPTGPHGSGSARDHGQLRGPRDPRSSATGSARGHASTSTSPRPTAPGSISLSAQQPWLCELVREPLGQDTESARTRSLAGRFRLWEWVRRAVCDACDGGRRSRAGATLFPSRTKREHDCQRRGAHDARRRARPAPGGVWRRHQLLAAGRVVAGGCRLTVFADRLGIIPIYYQVGDREIAVSDSLEDWRGFPPISKSICSRSMHS